MWKSSFGFAAGRSGPVLDSLTGVEVPLRIFSRGRSGPVLDLRGVWKSSFGFVFAGRSGPVLGSLTGVEVPFRIFSRGVAVPFWIFAVCRSPVLDFVCGA